MDASPDTSMQTLAGIGAPHDLAPRAPVVYPERSRRELLATARRSARAASRRATSSSRLSRRGIERDLPHDACCPQARSWARLPVILGVRMPHTVALDASRRAS